LGTREGTKTTLRQFVSYETTTSQVAAKPGLMDKLKSMLPGSKKPPGK
jgi:hypothetical protein